MQVLLSLTLLLVHLFSRKSLPEEIQLCAVSVEKPVRQWKKKHTSEVWATYLAFKTGPHLMQTLKVAAALLRIISSSLGMRTLNRV